MSEEKKLVRVKLVKHEWPDERAARYKRYLISPFRVFKQKINSPENVSLLDTT